MAFIVKQKERELPSEGTHDAVLVHLIDLGTSEDKLFGTIKRDALMGFELQGRTSEGKRHIVSGFFDQTMNPKSKLFKTVVAWQGRMSKAEAKEFDLETLLGKSAVLNIQHTDSGNAKICSIAPTAPNAEELEPESEIFSFWLDDFPDNQEIFEGLSDFAKDRIKSSKEYLEKK